MSQRYGDIFDICSASVFTGDAYSAGEFNTEVARALQQLA
jgi:hypothetical protein